LKIPEEKIMKTSKGNPNSILNPPDNCPFCRSRRIGIQEGEIIFACRTLGDFRETHITERIKYKKSPKCRIG
jgi:hypothetical protein